MNFNFHSDLADPIQRLAIAMEPATCVRPHRHAQTWELLTALRGRFIVIDFDDEGVVCERSLLGSGGAAALEIGAGVWHAVVSLDPGAIILEVKRGPYAPVRAEDLAPWSSASEDAALVAWYGEAQVGDRWHS
jgi:cupin fold WbuC family metalloprotein